MGEWKRAKLGDVCTRVCSGGTPKSTCNDYYENGEIPWLNTKEVHSNRIYDTEKKITQLGLDNSSAKWISADSVIVAMYGATAGNVAQTRIPLTTNQACCNLEIDSAKASADFVFYYLRSCYSRLLLLANGAAQQNLNAQVLREYEIPLPPLPTQRKIAAVLGALDDKIENNRKICANLEAQAQAIFKSWFVDFEPFGGKMPQGWKMGKLGDVAEITSGKRPPSRTDFQNSQNIYPLIGASSVMGFTSEFLYDRPILVMGRVGTHGIIQRFDNKVWPSDNTLVLISEYHEYVYQILKLIDYKRLNRGSTQPLITQTDIKESVIVLPKDNWLKKFEDYAGLLMKQWSAVECESRALAATRDALLPKLMSGEIDVEKVKVA